MTSLAIGYKNAGGGKQSRTDGLMKHLGTIDAGSLRVADDQASALKLGAGMELTFNRGTRMGAIQAYDRETGTYLDLSIQAKSIAIFPQGGGTFQLPANAIDGSVLKDHSVANIKLMGSTADDLEARIAQLEARVASLEAKP
jgi:hypothetical protein